VKTIIGNVCFIRDEARREALFLKRNREPMKGLYTGVGGKTGFFEDIHESCLREISEETGLIVSDLQCRGVIKTILDGKDSCWILFVYVAGSFTGKLIECDEGELRWVPYDQIYSLKLIGFIEEILPALFQGDQFVEGTIRHTLDGVVLEKKLKIGNRSFD
jgi:8-oxo-dGTP diphosphatase